MNKKLLFATLSLAALASCSTDDLEVHNAAEELTSPVKFEVLNNNELTRAYMDGSTLRWEASQGDLFTLYHGGEEPMDPSDPYPVKGYDNAAYKAETDGENASLSTPTMIKKGLAIMVWPVDTTFRITTNDNLTIQIPEKLENVEHNIPYVSDLINIGAYDEKAPYNTAGKDRKYPIYMRPMASQLTVKADYAGTDATIAELYTGDDPINPIKLTNVDLLTKSGGTTPFTQEITLKFTNPTAAITKQWKDAANNNAWVKVTDFDLTSIKKSVEKLSTKVINGTESAKFLLLPQEEMKIAGNGVEEAAVAINTIYGKVVVAAPGVSGSQYTAEEIADAWYRFLSEKPATDADGETTADAKETAGEGAGKYKATSRPEFGLKQTINYVTTKTATKGVIKDEPVGTSLTRYVKVNLNYLDMSDLHIKTDKQLRDAARVWQHIGAGKVTVILDGDNNKEFQMSQQTITAINEINAAADEEGKGRSFSVQPCTETGEECETIVFTGGGEIAQNLTFIKANGTTKAAIALNAGESWKWAASTDALKKVTVDAANTGISSFINRGTFVSDATATLAIYNNADPSVQVTIPFENAKGAEWNVTAGDLKVQFDVTNYGTVNITNGAEYIQDKAGSTTTTFTNEAQTLPGHFLEDANDEVIGVVNNSGVFATVNGGKINNYGLIEHAHKNAKTYISANQTTSADFGIKADHTTAGDKGNKIGRINLPLDNAKEDNISINSVSTAGFVSITATGSGTLKLGDVSKRVNYLIVKGSYTAFDGSVGTIEYVELNQPGTEIEWGSNAALKGLMVMSNINIKQTSNITIDKAAFLHKNAKMYVGGKCTNNKWSGYYGDTEDNFKTNYRTY